MGYFQIPSNIINFKSDKDLTEYDKDLSALDIRCGLIPCPNSFNIKEPIADIMPIYKTPVTEPSAISIYTNIPISNKANEKLINGGIYQLLGQIPIKSFNQNSLSSIQYFPQKILHKNITLNYKLDVVEIILVDAETDKPLNMNSNNITLNLEFKHGIW